MVGMLAIAAAAGWLLAFSLCAVVTGLPPRWAGAAAPWPGLSGERPALVNLVVTRGRLNGAAYPGHHPRSRGQGPSRDHTTGAGAAVVRRACRCTGGRRPGPVRAAGAR